MLRVGVLCIQGGFEEHMNMVKAVGCCAVDVRGPKDLDGLDGLVLPGGESTTIGLVARDNNLIEPIRKLIHEEKLPIMGTCAGMIVLSENVTDQRHGGQALFGGLHTTVRRNGFGRQINSFESPVTVAPHVAELIKPMGSEIFIRAPYVMEMGEDVVTLATVTHSFKDRYSVHHEHQPEENQDITVAVRQDNIFAISFHPELTDDTCWHAYFRGMVEEAKAKKTAQ
eukprot:TRINITY_DN73405_c0_g1_i1.p2 TRINITY_DN73405_c0_g1~~TRINITY_DN73405_c0_g1_i1.p2  ORF type:complete len:226 (+),score=79.11 TRINITY_DN73405_c0_g1_i1:61-738(+)